MSGARKSRNSSDRKNASIGKKPVAEPTTVSHVFLMIVMHVCRKSVLIEQKIKVPVYLAGLVAVSLVTDFLPFPRSYFADKSNVFNQVFVKWGWAWTLLCTGFYIGLTAYVYCCGIKSKVQRHFYRLLVGTVNWFVWTKLFVLIDSLTAGCLNSKFTTKAACMKQGHAWVGFDISGHAFLLIYCSLIIAEEAKSIRGWERIGEMLRIKDFEEESPLKVLTPSELEHLRHYYERLLPYVRLSFIVLTSFMILWDGMLLVTILYFHHMVQKAVGGIIAICIWFVTYRWWFTMDSSPGLPGQGLFKYSQIPATILKKSSGVCRHSS